MMRKYIVIILLAFSYQTFGQDSLKVKQDNPLEEFFTLEKIRSVFTPRTIQWQYAGNIGMHSIGADWNIYKKKINAGLSLGYVPDSRSISPLFIGNFHLNYNSQVKIKLGNNLRLEPLNFSFIISTTYGDRFSIYEDEKYYPEYYYWWGVRTRYGISHNLDLYYQFENSFIEGVSIYLNSSVWDVEFYSVFGNDNLQLDKVPVARLITFGLGLKFYL